MVRLEEQAGCPGSSESHMFLWTDSTLMAGAAAGGRRWPPGPAGCLLSWEIRHGGTTLGGALREDQPVQAAEHSTLPLPEEQKLLPITCN